MAAADHDPIPLTPAEQKLTVGIAIALFVLAGAAVYFPHTKTTKRFDHDHCYPSVITEDADQGPIGITLFTIAAVVLVYGINGFKLSKFSFGSASAETATMTSKVVNPASLPQTPAGAGKPFDQFNVAEKRLLATLGQNQKTNQGGRWGIGLPPRSPGYAEFFRSAASLLSAGLVTVDDQGMIYLSDSGLQYVEQNPNRDAIEHHQDVFRGFRAAWW